MLYFFQDIKYIFVLFSLILRNKRKKYVSLTFQIQDCTSILKSPFDEKQNTECKGNRVASIRCRTPSVECDDNSGDHWHCGRYKCTISLNCESAQSKYTILEDYFDSFHVYLKVHLSIQICFDKRISYCFSVTNVSV